MSQQPQGILSWSGQEISMILFGIFLKLSPFIFSKASPSSGDIKMFLTVTVLLGKTIATVYHVPTHHSSLGLHVMRT